MSDPSNAGPFEVGLNSPLGPGEMREIRFPEVKAGPSNKAGYLRKIFGQRGGMDYIFVVNTSPELLKVEVGSGATAIPSATSQNLSNGPYRSIRVTNRGGTIINEDDTDDVSVQVGNGNRNEDEKAFSSRRAISSIVPGLEI